MRAHFRAPPRVLKQVRRHLQAALEIVQRETRRGAGGKQGPLYSLTLALLPLRGRNQTEGTLTYGILDHLLVALLALVAPVEAVRAYRWTTARLAAGDAAFGPALTARPSGTCSWGEPWCWVCGRCRGVRWSG